MKVSLAIINTADPRYTTPISSTALQHPYISDRLKLTLTEYHSVTHSTTLKALRIRVILRMRRTLTTLKILASCRGLAVVGESESSSKESEHPCI